MFSFGSQKPVDPKKNAREGKREIERGKRDVERQRLVNKREQEKVTAEIKRAARQGNKDVVKTLAKQLVQLRNHEAKLMGFTANMSSMQMQMTSMAATASMGTAMAKATGVLKQQNAQMQQQNMMHVARDFAMATERMDMTQEMMDDALADAFEDDEAEADDVVAQVLAEVGVEHTAALAGVGATPAGAVAAPAGATATPTARTAVPAGGGGAGADEAEMKRIMAELGI